MFNVLKEMFGENLLIAIIPVVGYIVALFYQYGYASYFEFPFDLIKIDLEMTLTSTIWAAVYFSTIAIFFDFYTSFTPSKGVFSKIIKNVLSFSILPFILMFVTAFDRDIFHLFLASMLAGFLFWTVPPLLIMKGIGYKKHLLIC